MEDFYTIEEASRALGVSTKSIRSYIKKGLLMADLEGGSYKVRVESVRNFPGKKPGKVEASFSTPSGKVLVDQNHYEGLLTRLGQLQAAVESREQKLIEYQGQREADQREAQEKIQAIKEKAEKRIAAERERVRELEEALARPWWRRIFG